MKTLNKKEFIPFLKNISDKLNKEDIKHDIPYCHIDKIKFNKITIIIPDHITIYDIGKLFNCEKIKEKSSIIDAIIDDFLICFVKSSDKNWYYNFYFFSWDILHIFVDVIFDNYFGLRYTLDGLKYKYLDNLVKVSKNLQEIFEFLELKFYMLNTGFPTDYVIYNFIESSPFYDSDFFTLDDFKKRDNYYEYNKQYYENFIKIKKELTAEKKSKDDIISYIDMFFPNSNIIEKIAKIKIKKDFPYIKEKIVIKTKDKSLQELADEKKEENKRKKISLKNILNKDNKDNKDYKLE